VLDAETGKEVGTFAHPETSPTWTNAGVAIAPKAEFVAAAHAWNRGFSVWQGGTEKPQFWQKGAWHDHAFFLPGAKELVALRGRGRCTIETWDVATQKLKSEVKSELVGTPALEGEFTSRGFTLDDGAPDLVVLGFDTGLTYAKLWTLCNHVRAGRPYFATHPDFTCVTDTGYMPDIGATIAFVRGGAGGRDPDLVIGKPNRIIAEQAAARAGVPVSALCMIGDQLDTDIALGASADIPTMLVLTGEASVERIPEAPHAPDLVFASIGAVAEYLEAHLPG
jgi:ribonucleotide monophosphatase NagD (HAD superfamily)